MSLLFAALACTGTPEDTGPPPPVATVHLTFADHDGTWTTADGWSVSLEVGYAITTTVELITCPTDDLGKDHGVAVDERLRAPHVEMLHDPVDQVMGTLVMDVGALCDAAWLLGKSTTSDELADAPVEVDLVGQGLSLYLEGSATPETGGVVHFAGGSARDLVNELPLEDRVGLSDLDLTVTRDLATLFDGIDFATASAQDVADAVVENLALSVTFSVD